MATTFYQLPRPKSVVSFLLPLFSSLIQSIREIPWACPPKAIQKLTTSLSSLSGVNNCHDLLTSSLPASTSPLYRPLQQSSQQASKILDQIMELLYSECSKTFPFHSEWKLRPLCSSFQPLLSDLRHCTPTFTPPSGPHGSPLLRQCVRHTAPDLWTGCASVWTALPPETTSLTLWLLLGLCSNVSWRDLSPFPKTTLCLALCPSYWLCIYICRIPVFFTFYCNEIN